MHPLLRSTPMVVIVAVGLLSGCSDPDETGDGAGKDVGQEVGEDTSPTDTAGDAHGEQSQRTALVEADDWEKVSSEDDPFDDAPDGAECDEEGYGTENLDGDDSFVVASGQCDYLTVSQSARVDVDAGDEIFTRLWHFDLDAPDGGQAHLAVSTAQHIIFEEQIPIPADGALLTDTSEAPETIVEGEPIYFHFHNHGSNEYYLIEVSVER